MTGATLPPARPGNRLVLLTLTATQARYLTGALRSEIENMDLMQDGRHASVLHRILLKVVAERERLNIE